MPPKEAPPRRWRLCSSGNRATARPFSWSFSAGNYRRFLSREENRKYTFKFLNLDRLGTYGKITTIESQTYEDPMILAMNLLPDPDDNRAFLAKSIGFTDKQHRGAL